MAEEAEVIEPVVESKPVETTSQDGMSKAFEGFTRKETPKEEPKEEPVAEEPKSEEAPLERLEEEPKAEEPKVEEKPKEEVPVEEPKVEEPKAEEPKEEQPKSETEKLELIDLGKKEEEKPKAEFDYGSFAKELGVEGSTKEDIVEAFKTKSVSTEEKPDTVYSRAEKINSEGGNAMAYLFAEKTKESIAEMSSKELLADRYKEEAKNNEDFNLDDIIDDLGVAEASYRANEHRKTLLSNAEGAQSEIQRETADNKLRTDNGIKDALDRLESVGVFRVSPEDKDIISNDLKTGKLFDEIYYDSDGKKDYKLAAERIFRFRNAERMEAHWKTVHTNNGTKKVIERLGNHDINEPRVSSPQIPNSKEKPSPIGGLIEHFKKEKG